MREVEKMQDQSDLVVESEGEEGVGIGGEVVTGEEEESDSWEGGIEDVDQDGDVGSMKKYLEMNDDDEVPGWRVEGIGEFEEGERAEGLLKLLLPLAKVVKDRMREDDAKTMEEVEKRERAEAWQKNIMGEDGNIKKNRSGYYEQEKL